MKSYIRRLEDALLAENDVANAVHEAIRELRVYLNSAKFTADDGTGERTNWISTSELLDRLRTVNDTIPENTTPDAMILVDKVREKRAAEEKAALLA